MENETAVPSSGNCPLISRPETEGAAQSTHLTQASGEGRDGGGIVAASAPLGDWEGEPKSKPADAPPGEVSSDPELEELLDCE